MLTARFTHAYVWLRHRYLRFRIIQDVGAWFRTAKHV